MTEKRFELKGVERQFLWDNKNAGNMAHWIANKMSIVDLLNELNDENNHIKQTIREAYNNERTQIGRNVLRQLMEAIQ